MGSPPSLKRTRKEVLLSFLFKDSPLWGPCTVSGHRSVCGGAHVQTSYSTLGHLAPLHFHFTELNPGALECCAQEKATAHAVTSGLGPRSARARVPRAAPARGSPGANLLPLILEDVGVPAAAPGASRRGPAGPHAEGQIVPSAAPRAPPRPRSPRPSGPASASASGDGKWAAPRPPLLPLGPGGCTKLLGEK